MLKSISVIRHLSKNFIHISFYIFETSNNSKPVLVKIRIKLHFVKRLKAKILVGNNTLVLEGFVLDLLSKDVTISSYNTKIRISMKSQS